MMTWENSEKTEDERPFDSEFRYSVFCRLCKIFYDCLMKKMHSIFPCSSCQQPTTCLHKWTGSRCATMNQSLISPRCPPAWKKCSSVPAYSATLRLRFDLCFLFFARVDQGKTISQQEVFEYRSQIRVCLKTFSFSQVNWQRYFQCSSEFYILDNSSVSPLMNSNERLENSSRSFQDTTNRILKSFWPF